MPLQVFHQLRISDEDEALGIDEARHAGAAYKDVQSLEAAGVVRRLAPTSYRDPTEILPPITSQVDLTCSSFGRRPRVVARGRG